MRVSTGDGSISAARSPTGWTPSIPTSAPTASPSPDIVETYADPGFVEYLVERLRGELAGVPAADAVHTVFAVSGLMEFYDFVHVSALLEALDSHLPGIVVLFFPGEREGNTYRFLGARTGWNYLATPILTD